MAWEHLSVTKAHLVYIILGGFTSLFMLCSSVIKERLYIGEATVATICGIIFGPHAANLINPLTWGNTDLITLEFSRIVLVVQCFAVGVELPRAYMERHWKSVTLLLIPVMTFGWLITSLFIWALFGNHLNWLDSLCCAACVTATDPVLASSVVGKGKFAKRVPKHIRDLLSAESGCNDGMAFPFIYLAIYVIRYKHHPNEVALHWFCISILYECVFGAIYGVAIGYIARRLIRMAHERDLIDRESFLVFYFVLALFCAGSGSLLGMDDLLIGFACGVGFSNDGWFLEKTEESHVSNVIDLLINLAFFVYFGTIIPWAQFNSDVIGIQPWRLVVLGILVLLFRRIPIMLLLKPIIPDIKTWREALFCGHFGPIGVGAIFVAILARAELETEESTPLAQLPEPGFEHLNIIEMIWPLTTFLVIISIIVHGSSVAVFTLGKHINTLTLTLSYTQANEEGPSWMDRLPRIQSRSKSSMSMRRADSTDVSDVDEKDPRYSSGGLPPVGMPGNFLRRQKEEEKGGDSRSSSLGPRFRRKKWDQNIGPGGPISQSAIAPRSRSNRDHADVPDSHQTDSETLAMNESPDEAEDKKGMTSEPEEEVYYEGDKTIIEDEEGNVLKVMDSSGESPKQRKKHVMQVGQELMEEKDVEHGVSQADDPESNVEAGPKAAEGVAHGVKEAVEHPGQALKGMRQKMGLTRRGTAGPSSDSPARPKPAARMPTQKRGPALAYQYGNTIIVEDEDGEVVKKYEIPNAKKPARPDQGERKPTYLDNNPKTRQRLNRMGTYLGMGAAPEENPEAGPSESAKSKRKAEKEKDDRAIRFTIGAGGRRMSKADFLAEVQRLDPKARAAFVEKSDAPEAVKREAKADAKEHDKRQAAETTGTAGEDATVERVGSKDSRPAGPEGLVLMDSNDQPIPFHSVSDDLAQHAENTGGETAAQRRRREATTQRQQPSRGRTSSSRAGVEEETPAERRRREGALGLDLAPTAPPEQKKEVPTHLDEEETAAERKRREGALGVTRDEDESDEEVEGGVRHPPQPQPRNIRFADPQRPTTSSSTGGGNNGGGTGSRTLRWSADVGRKAMGRRHQG